MRIRYTLAVGPRSCPILLACSLWLACGVGVGARPASASEVVEVHVRHVGFDRQARTPVVILEDVEGTRFLPIWVGSFEARAIAMELDGVASRRPLTHDLIKNVLEQVGIEFRKVVVSALEKNTYFARIHLRSDERPVEVDSRPSDAIALALRFDRPIFVVQEVFDATGHVAPQPISTALLGIEVQNLTAELAAYFELSNVDGVLVTNVAESHSVVQRGDVILALNGEFIRNVSDFREKTLHANRSVRLLIRRSGRDVGVNYTPRK